MKKLNARERMILVITLGLVFLFLVYQFLIKPIHEGAIDIDDRLRVDQDRLIKVRHMENQKNPVGQRYNHLVDLIGLANAQDAQMPNIIAKVENSARESNVHVVNIQPQKSAAQKGVQFMAVELEIDGQWLDIVQFLYLLQQQPNFYFIEELNLEKYSDMTNSLRGRIVISRMSLVNL